MGLVSEKGKFYICQVSDSFVRMGGGSLTEKKSFKMSVENEKD